MHYRLASCESDPLCVHKLWTKKPFLIQAIAYVRRNAMLFHAAIDDTFVYNAVHSTRNAGGNFVETALGTFVYM